MNEGVKFSWSAPEYEERERTADWFWAVGVIAVTAAITSIIYSNYFFAILILLGAGLLWHFAIKPPEWITYELTDKGLQIKSHLYPYANIKSFWVEKEEKPALFLRTERFFMPVLSIPIERGDTEVIENIFLDKQVLEEEMKEHPSEKIMDRLGF